MLKCGDQVKINGKSYQLGEKIGGGQEGSVFNVENFPNHVIKIINDEKLSAPQKEMMRRQFQWLLNLGAQNKNISQLMTVPKALLDHQLGYIMLKAGEHDSLNQYLNVPEDIAQNFDQWYRRDYPLKKRYQIIINLFRALRDLHLAGLVFTDLSPNNILIHQKENQIVFIDTDNIRNRLNPYSGVIGTPGYMAPEIYRTPTKTVAPGLSLPASCWSQCGKISAESDIFSASVIAFQLLTLQHPYIGDQVEAGAAELEEMALAIKTDYILKKGTKNFSTHNLVPHFEHLTTPEIRSLFSRVFVDGKDNPYLRPTAEEFLEAFQNALDRLVECPHCGYSQIYALGENNLCLNCQSKLGPKMAMIVYNAFHNLSRDEIINGIGDYPQYNVELDNLLDCHGQPPASYQAIAKIILEPGEAHAKVLSLRHFESTTERSKSYARVTLSENENYVKVEILNHVFASPYLIEKQTRQLIPLGRGKENIKYDRYQLVFDNKKFGKGNLQIFCEFVKR